MGLGGSYIGEGMYHERDANGIVTKEYKLWRAMLQRCYGESYKKRQRTYEGCYVCEDWLNFQNFAKWVNENYYTIPNSKVQLDKDILFPGNKLYSPDFCCFVPIEINLVFSKNNSDNDSNSIGVDVVYNKKGNKYKARCRMGNNYHKTSKIFNTFEEAREWYIKCKTKRIHELAEKYKEYIPDKLYNVLLEYNLKHPSN